MLPLEVDSLTFEVVVDNLLLFADHLGLARDLLEKDLHKIHLAKSQRVHFAQRFFYLVLVLRLLHVFEVGCDGVRGIVSFSSG